MRRSLWRTKRTFSNTRRGGILVKRGQVQSTDATPRGYDNKRQKALTTAAGVAALNAITLRTKRENASVNRYSIHDKDIYRISRESMERASEIVVGVGLEA